MLQSTRDFITQKPTNTSNISMDDLLRHFPSLRKGIKDLIDTMKRSLQYTNAFRNRFNNWNDNPGLLIADEEIVENWIQTKFPYTCYDIPWGECKMFINIKNQALIFELFKWIQYGYQNTFVDPLTPSNNTSDFPELIQLVLIYIGQAKLEEEGEEDIDLEKLTSTSDSTVPDNTNKRGGFKLFDSTSQSSESPKSPPNQIGNDDQVENVKIE